MGHQGYFNPLKHQASPGCCGSSSKSLVICAVLGTHGSPLPWGLCRAVFSWVQTTKNSATRCKSVFLHMKHLFAVTLPPSQNQNPKDWGGIGMTAGSAALGPCSGRQRHLAEEEVIKQLGLLRAAGWR
uniref:Uncharacterized protein n=1 Tax=Junco hyemalis TaxID=40217 RepID=A0A8C5IDT3_JUNHY